MIKQSPNGERFMSTVKVGPKGQIVIPKEARDMFGISPGDTLIFLADKKEGMALAMMSAFSEIADAILKGKGSEIYPDHSEKENENFAMGIKQLEEEL